MTEYSGSGTFIPQTLSSRIGSNCRRFRDLKLKERETKWATFCLLPVSPDGSLAQIATLRCRLIKWQRNGLTLKPFAACPAAMNSESPQIEQFLTTNSRNAKNWARGTREISNVASRSDKGIWNALLRAIAGDSELVLPGRSSLRKPIGHNTLNKSLEDLAFAMPAITIHDMRRTASTILHNSDFKPDVIEVSLGHKIGGIPLTYISVNDFLNIARQLRTVPELLHYLDARRELPGGRTVCERGRPLFP
jgi:hypothetical protein